MKRIDKRSTLGRHLSVTLPGRRVYFSVYGQEAIEYDRLNAAQKLHYARIRDKLKGHKFALAVAKRDPD